MILKISFTPFDSLFFRDGSPFNRQEIQANVNSIFPPSPTTLIGAIRAAWAKTMGWSGYGDWNNDIVSALGSHFSLPDGMNFDGPYLSKNDDLFFPAPAHLMGIEPKTLDNSGEFTKPEELVFLDLVNPYETDLGEVFLPSIPFAVEGQKPLNGNWWVNSEGMNSILLGKVPDEKSLIHYKQLWQVEQRIGNFSRANESRTTGLNSLYSPQHIRLLPGVELVMFSSGLPEIKEEKPVIIPVGGEARMCELRFAKECVSKYLNVSSPINNTNKQILIALTPVRLDRAICAGDEIADAIISSMCNSRPIMRGGWDIDKPRQLEPYLPAGTVLFLKAKTAEQVKSIGNVHIVGRNSSWGFGRLVTGQRP